MAPEPDISGATIRGLATATARVAVSEVATAVVVAVEEATAEVDSVDRI